MQVRRFQDPNDYAQRVLPFLLLAPARHNLLLGILDTLQRHPATYPAFHLWAVEEGGVVVGAALQTPPHNLVVAQPAHPQAVESLVEAVSSAGLCPPGVVGGTVETQAFAVAWCGRHGGDHDTLTRQGIYELTTVRDAGSAPGGPRPATADDLAMLVAWHEDFLDEAVAHHIRDIEMTRRRLTTVIQDGGFWLWEDAGRVVSMTGVTPALPDGARIGPVYTPPALRGRGYATALVAHASVTSLARGARACYLHTDLANPTSNAIYQRIGYEWVCEAVDLRFTPG